jgi:hypothetical protein
MLVNQQSRRQQRSIIFDLYGRNEVEIEEASKQKKQKRLFPSSKDHQRMEDITQRERCGEYLYTCSVVGPDLRKNHAMDSRAKPNRHTSLPVMSQDEMFRFFLKIRVPNVALILSHDLIMIMKTITIHSRSLNLFLL